MKPVTRRSFIVSSTASLTAAASASAAGANARIHVGVIGCGSMGKGDARTLAGCGDVDFPIVCDVDDHQSNALAKQMADAVGKKPEVVKDFRRVVERDDLDVCLIATTDHWHALPTIYACETGKDVYVEKPFANTIAESRAMVNAAKKHKRIVQMGSQWRSFEHVQAAAAFVRSGKLGTIRMVRAWNYQNKRADSPGFVPEQGPPPSVDYDFWLGPAPKRPYHKNRFHRSWRYFWDYGGGNASDNGVHLIGVCLWPMGMQTPLRASSSGGKYAYDDNTETPDTQIFTITFPEYTFVWEHMQGSTQTFQDAGIGMEWRGTAGRVVIDDRGWRATPNAEGNFESEDHRPGKVNPRITHMKEFLTCIANRTQPVYNPDEAHYATTVSHLGNLAFRSGAEIQWDANNERATNNPAANALITPEYRAPWKLES